MIKIKNIYIGLLFCFSAMVLCSSLIEAAPADLPQVSDASSNVSVELQTLDHIISMTKENLTAQKVVKQKVQYYYRLQQAYLANPDDRELLFRMVKTSFKLLEIINNNHLQHAFSDDFLHELDVFAQVAVKRGIPRPK
jgi:hypothetical protein